MLPPAPAMVMVLTGNHSLNLSSEIGLDDVLHFSFHPGRDIDPELMKEVDGPGAHPPCNHHVCLLGVDELGNDPRLMVRIVGILDHFGADNPVSVHVDKGVKRASSEMGTDPSLQA